MKLRRELFRFGIVGAINTAFGILVILSLQNLLGLNPTAANVSGYLIGAVLGFFLHRHWTFSFNAVSLTDRAPIYGAVLITCYLLNLVVLHGALAAGANESLAQIIAVAVYSVAHFTAGKWFAFPKREEKS